ncbi:MAG: ACP S-malonyltransferase, partial [Planctomycetota bacterium]
LVRERGLGMQEASEAVASGLVAIRSDLETAEAICEAGRAATGGVLGVANINAPGQIVISGDDPSLEAAAEAARDHGIRRVVRLPVAGGFHSALMASGAERLQRALEGVTVHAPRFPVISNVTAKPTTDPDTIRANLVAQVTSPVRFTDCVGAARGLGVETTLEVGPGRVLSGLVRRIVPEITTVTAEDAEAIRRLGAASAETGGAQ